MARPTKSGIDYFPLDVELEDKVKILEAKHGLVGFAVWIKLMQKIYKHGYYIKWEEENKILFASEVNEPIEKINEIILDCVNYEIFNTKKFEKHNILTSRGIQKRYLEATKRRKEVEVCKHYLLTNGVNDYKNLVYVNNNSENVDNNSQSKVEEKRAEKKSVCDGWPKPNNLPEENNRYIYPDEFEEIWEAYPDRPKDNKKGAYRKIRQLIKSDAEQQDLLSAAENYQTEQENEDNIGTKYVKMCKTFFGPDEHYRAYINIEVEEKSLEEQIAEKWQL